MLAELGEKLKEPHLQLADHSPALQTALAGGDVPMPGLTDKGGQGIASPCVSLSAPVRQAGSKGETGVCGLELCKYPAQKAEGRKAVLLDTLVLLAGALHVRVRDLYVMARRLVPVGSHH